jgi:hypothetical protein
MTKKKVFEMQDEPLSELRQRLYCEMVMFFDRLDAAPEAIRTSPLIMSLAPRLEEIRGILTNIEERAANSGKTFVPDKTPLAKP